MRDSFVMFFTSITSLFSALNNTASALNEVALVANNTAKAFRMEEDVKHQAKMLKLNAALALNAKAADTDI